MKNGKSKNCLLAFKKIIPYARNPRINDAAVPKIASAIKEFGFRVPVIIRSDGEVADGHVIGNGAELTLVRSPQQS